MPAEVGRRAASDWERGVPERLEVVGVAVVVVVRRVRRVVVRVVSCGWVGYFDVCC